SETRLEARLDWLQLDLSDCGVSRPAGEAAEQYRDPRMSRELRHLRGRHRADAVAAVVQHEPLFAGDAVAAQTQADLRGERLEHLAVAHRRRRPEHEWARPGDVPAGVRIRPAHVAEDEVVGPELGLEPLDVDDGGQVRHARGTLAGCRSARPA